MLEENHPFRIMEKGYSIVENMQGNLISDSNDLKEGSDYRVIFNRGKAVFRFLRQEREADDVRKKY